MLGDFLVTCNKYLDNKDIDQLVAGTPIAVHDPTWGYFYQFGVYISTDQIVAQRLTRDGIIIKSYTLDDFINHGSYEIYEYVPWYNYSKDIVYERAVSTPLDVVAKGIYSPCGDDFLCWCITGDPNSELLCYNNIGQHYSEGRRKVIKYKHHAIGIEAGLVVHFSDNESGKLAIVIGKLENLKAPKCIFHDNYNTESRIKARNLALLYALHFRDIKKYNLMTNNCEHFVNECITGKHQSGQIRDAYGDLAIIALTALTRRPTPMLNKVIKRYLL